MNVVFYGNGSSGNHGCEAIIRGTVELLGSNGYRILSENCMEDSRYGLSSLAEILPARNERKKDAAFLKAYAKLKLTGKYTDMDGLYYSQAIQKCKGSSDVALSIGGDNYCYGNAAIYAYLNQAFQKQGIKTVLWGCSIEPDIVGQTAVSKDLKEYDLIAARESITFQAVRDAGANVQLMPDPAFYMPQQEPKTSYRLLDSNTIGVNISPYIITSEKNDGAAYANYKSLIRFILDNTDAKIALIPHVVWATNDDRVPLKQLYDDFGQDSRLILVGDHTAPELKSIISKCSFFVGARTHATIAAYSTAVPTLVVGYSVKARGIARDLFGTEEDYVLPVQGLKESDELTKTFSELYERCGEIKAHLEKTLPDYLSRGEKARSALEEIANT